MPVLRELYDLYSFNVIPKIGAAVANDEASYQYLVESIRRFPDQVGRWPGWLRLAWMNGRSWGQLGGWPAGWLAGAAQRHRSVAAGVAHVGPTTDAGDHGGPMHCCQRVRCGLLPAAAAGP